MILKRNATRDYLDFTALVDRLSPAARVHAMEPFDRFYSQASGQSGIQQLLAQTSNVMPLFDLDESEPVS